MGYLKSTGTVIIYTGLFFALLAFLPGLPPDAKFSEYSVSPPLHNLKPNQRLDNAEILFNGELKGPESFASYNGELYTGLHGGDVVKIVGKHIVPIVKFGQPCDAFWEEQKCGRPLGLQFDKNGVLYVSDAYYGIFKVDVNSGKYDKIIDFSASIEGLAVKLPNSLDIAANGDIYWTDSSTEFTLQDGAYSMLSNPSGRLIKYDAATKKNTVLINNLGFANGVKLSKDESFVIVAESLSSRLTKFHLKGNKAGRAETFAEGLPGLPDNIHTDGGDGFLVSLVVSRDDEHPSIVATLAPHPYIRRMFARLLYILEAPFKLIDDVYPNYLAKRVVHWIGHFESGNFLHSRNVIVLRVDASGKIIDTSSNSDEQISFISSAYIFKDYLYLGSPYNEYLAKVPLNRAFPSIKPQVGKVITEQEVKKVPKSVEESKPATPKPTTTTTPPPPPTKATTPPPVVTKPATPQPATKTTAKSAEVPTTPKPVQTPPQKPTPVPTPAPQQQKQQPPPQQQQQQQKQQQQQQRPPTTSDGSSKEKKSEPPKQVPSSSTPPPPPPPPSTKPASKESAPVQKEAQKPAGSGQLPNNAQKVPPKPEIKNTGNVDANKKEQAKPSPVTVPPPRN